MTRSRMRALADGLRVHAGAFLAIALCTGVVACAILDRGGSLLAVDPLGGYFDALADSMRHGRFDVPREAIGYEAIVIDGRSYGYFGPTPALLHGLLDQLWPAGRGKWMRLCMLLCTAATGALVYALARRVNGRESSAGTRVVACALVLASLFATPLVAIALHPVIYHESLFFGVALALATYGALVAYDQEGGRWRLAAAGLAALLAFQARGSVGVGAMVAFTLVVARDVFALVLRRVARRGDAAPTERAKAVNALVVGALFGALALGILVKNVRVFGNLSGAPPLSLHVALTNDPARAARTDGGNFVQPRNLRTTLYAYFDPTNVTVRATTPFVLPRRGDQVRVFPETKLDHRERHASLTATSPAFVLLTLLGLGFAFAGRRAADVRFVPFRIPMIGALLGGASIFVVACITHRYLGDLVPLLVLGGIVGTHGMLDRARDSRGMRRFGVALVALVLVSAFASTTIGAQIGPGPG